MQSNNIRLWRQCLFDRRVIIYAGFYIYFSILQRFFTLEFILEMHRVQIPHLERAR